MRIILIILCLTLTVSVSFAQSSTKKKKKRPANERRTSSSLERHASSLEPYTPYAERATTRKKSTKRRDKHNDADPVQEFYARMGEVQKNREKNEKMMEKPQYSDPLYFGHRRPPKKRAPGKMKFCKECGIKH